MRDIWSHISPWMDLWERGSHVGLVGSAESESAAWGVEADQG